MCDGRVSEWVGWVDWFGWGGGDGLIFVIEHV